MPTPTDPYSSNSRRPFEDDEILAPIPPETAASPETSVAARQVKPPAYVDDSWTDTDIFPHAQGMDPAFDQQRPAPLDAVVTPVTPPEVSIFDDDEMDDDVVSPESSQSPAGAYSPASAGAAGAGIGGAAHTEVISDYSDIDYSFGADDDTEDNSGATATYPVATQQTSVIPTASPANAPTEVAFAPPVAAVPVAATAPIAPVAPVAPAASEPAPMNTWAAPATTSPVTADAAPELPFAPPLPDAPRGRGWTHTWVLLATLLLVPVGYYLLADSIYNLELGPMSPRHPVEGVPWLLLAELAGGLAVVVLVWIIARLSSLGAMVIGTLLALAGLVGVAAPSLAKTLVMDPLTNVFGPDNSLVNNVILHLGVGLVYGRILTFGVILLLTGIVSHSARRRGEKYASIVTRREIALGAAK
ncbi:MAG: hypothetical protein QM705_10935 [Ancrocorticia sp.]